MKRLWLLFPSAALLLGACAPAYNAQYRSGRIVNVTTGQEGRLLLGGAGSIMGRGSARIEFGQNIYQGEYNVLDNNVRVSVHAGLGFGSGFSPWYLSPEFTAPASPTRNGNLIARNAAGQVISCDFLVDAHDNGNGSCTDGAGARYTLQF